MQITWRKAKSVYLRLVLVRRLDEPWEVFLIVGVLLPCPTGDPSDGHIWVCLAHIHKILSTPLDMPDGDALTSSPVFQKRA